MPSGKKTRASKRGRKNSPQRGLASANATYRYVQNYSLGVLSVFGQTDPLPGGAAAYQFRLADLPNLSSFLSLYDQFKFEKVEICFEPTANMSAVINATEPPGGTNPAYRIPCIHTVIDFSDTNAPTAGASALFPYSTYRRELMNKRHSRTLQPRYSLITTAPGTVAPALGCVTGSDWQDVQFSQTKWAGVRVWVDPCSNQSVALDPLLIAVYVRATVAFRNVV